MEIKAAINNQAKEEEARKIKLENTFTPSIKSIFSRMTKAFEAVYTATGNIPSFNPFAADWRSALKRQYERTGKEFTNNARKSEFVRDLVIKQDEEITSEQVAMVAAAYLAFSQSRSIVQSDFIISTSNTETIESVQKAISQLRIDNPLREPTNEEVARRAGKILRKKFSARVSTIANMETQAPAEEAKRLEVLALAGVAILPFQRITQPPKGVTKKWADVRDSSVRDGHAAANGQIKDMDSPFIVSGQLLKYPGDGSLGASIWNLANCRCSAFYAVSDKAYLLVGLGIKSSCSHGH